MGPLLFCTERSSAEHDIVALSVAFYCLNLSAVLEVNAKVKYLCNPYPYPSQDVVACPVSNILHCISKNLLPLVNTASPLLGSPRALYNYLSNKDIGYSMTLYDSRPRQPVSLYRVLWRALPPPGPAMRLLGQAARAGWPHAHRHPVSALQAGGQSDAGACLRSEASPSAAASSFPEAAPH